MRYLNWDVLLFPNGSRVPLQEFKTACYAIHDPEILHDDFVPGSMHTRQVPVVSTFVPNQTDGTPFKVSIHSWYPPLATESLKLLLEQGKQAGYEARVLVDGVLMASVVLTMDAHYPQVLGQNLWSFCKNLSANKRARVCFPSVSCTIDDSIELISVELDKNGQQDVLRWPVFHAEQLTQAYWSAGENMGRIKITIAEGFSHKTGDTAFVRTKNIVTFAFQHAPQHNLENSGIAWPNRKMWLPALPTTFNVASPTRFPQMVVDPDLHAHSPPRQRDVSGRLSIYDSMAPPSRAPSLRTMAPPMLPPPGLGPDAGAWPGAPSARSSLADPFTDRRARQRTDQSDISMPDYVHGPSPFPSRAPMILGRHGRSSTMTSSDGTVFDPFGPTLDSPPQLPVGAVPPVNSREQSTANSPLVQARRRTASSSLSSVNNDLEEDPKAIQEGASAPVSKPAAKKQAKRRSTTARPKAAATEASAGKNDAVRAAANETVSRVVSTTSAISASSDKENTESHERVNAGAKAKAQGGSYGPIGSPSQEIERLATPLGEKGLRKHDGDVGIQQVARTAATRSPLVDRRYA